MGLYHYISRNRMWSHLSKPSESWYVYSFMPELTIWFIIAWFTCLDHIIIRAINVDQTKLMRRLVWPCIAALACLVCKVCLFRNLAMRTAFVQRLGHRAYSLWDIQSFLISVLYSQSQLLVAALYMAKISSNGIQVIFLKTSKDHLGN